MQGGKRGMVKSVIDWIALVLVIIGGLNWGLAIWDINLVTLLFGNWAWLVNTVYALVGLSALWMIKLAVTE